MRLEFNPAERALWIDLLAVAAKDDGFIRANEETPYLSQQLAGMLVYEEKFFTETIEKFVEMGKIDRDENGILYICQWEKYATSSNYKRVLKHRLSKDGVMFGVSKEMPPVTHNITEHNKTKHIIKEIVPQIINYLNEKTGKKFSPKPEGTIRLITGRLKEGRTLDDFKRVIDVKTAKWGGDPKMDDYLRPDTLFRPSNFESYLNEQSKKPPVGQNTKMPTSREEEYKKARDEFIKKHGDDEDKMAEFSQQWWEAN